MQMNKYTNNPIHPCCNLILWDILVCFIVIMMSISATFPNLSYFLVIIIALIISFIPIVLMAIPHLGPIIQILFSIFWTLIVYAILEKIFTLSASPFWQRVIAGLIVFLIMLSLHLACAREMNLIPVDSYHSDNPGSSNDPVIDSRLQQYLDQYDQAMEMTNFAHSLPDNEYSIPIKNYIKNNASNIVRQSNHLHDCAGRYCRSTNRITKHKLNTALNDTLPMLENYINSLQDLISTYNQSINAQNKQSLENDHISFFQGCTTLESLNKRYKDLVKVYHPDSGNGNDKVFIEIKNEYEQLKTFFNYKS